MANTARRGYVNAPLGSTWDDPSIGWAQLGSAMASGSVATITVDDTSRFHQTLRFNVEIGLRDGTTGIYSNLEILEAYVTSGTTLAIVTRSDNTRSHAIGESLVQVWTADDAVNNPGPLTTTGSLPYLAASGAMAELLAGADRTFLVYDSGLPIARAIQAADIPDLSASYATPGSVVTYVSGSYVPLTRTVNGHALSGNIALTAGDVGALSFADLPSPPSNTALGSSGMPFGSLAVAVSVAGIQIGLPEPSFTATLDGAATVLSVTTNGVDGGTGTTAQTNYVFAVDSGPGWEVTHYRSRGIVAAPTNIQAGDTISSVTSYGFVNGDWTFFGPLEQYQFDGTGVIEDRYVNSSVPVGDQPDDADVDVRPRKLQDGGGRIEITQKAHEKLETYLEEAPFHPVYAVAAEEFRDRWGQAEKGDRDDVPGKSKLGPRAMEQAG